jgi:preprotein translocase subunit YajC
MQPAGPSFMDSVPFLLAFFAIFYFMIIRPQSKRMKDQDKFLSGLKKGDQVVTNGGLIGTIDSLNDRLATIEIADGVKVKVLRKQIAASAIAVLSEPKKETK